MVELDQIKTELAGYLRPLEELRDSLWPDKERTTGKGNRKNNGRAGFLEWPWFSTAKNKGIKFFIDSGAFTYMSNPKYQENTVEQWERFKDDYKKGVYDNMINKQSAQQTD